MTEESIRKLTAQLNKGITTEIQVVYLLVGIRKLIERNAQEGRYRTRYSGFQLSGVKS